MTFPSGRGQGEGLRIRTTWRKTLKRLLRQFPVLAFIAPFAAFILMMALKGFLPVAARFQYPIQVVVVSAVLVLVSSHKFLHGPVRPLSSIVIGVVVFALWIGPDQILPWYRHEWLFENPVTGTAQSSLPPALRSDVLGSEEHP